LAVLKYQSPFNYSGSQNLYYSLENEDNIPELSPRFMESEVPQEPLDKEVMNNNNVKTISIYDSFQRNEVSAIIIVLLRAKSKSNQILLSIFACLQGLTTTDFSNKYSKWPTNVTVSNRFMSHKFNSDTSRFDNENGVDTQEDSNTNIVAENMREAGIPKNETAEGVEEIRVSTDIRKALALVPKSVSKRKTFRRKLSSPLGGFVPKTAHRFVPPSTSVPSATVQETERDFIPMEQSIVALSEANQLPPAPPSLPVKPIVNNPIDDIINKAEVYFTMKFTSHYAIPSDCFLSFSVLASESTEVYH